MTRLGKGAAKALGRFERQYGARKGRAIWERKAGGAGRVTAFYRKGRKQS